MDTLFMISQYNTKSIEIGDETCGVSSMFMLLRWIYIYILYYIYMMYDGMLNPKNNFAKRNPWTSKERREPRRPKLHPIERSTRNR